jgi:hypothetical protein
VTTQLNYLSATTPFLRGVPNSMISSEWYRLLTSLISVAKDSQVVQEVADDTTGNDPDAIAGLNQAQSEITDLYFGEGNDADAIARTLQLADLIDQFEGVGAQELQAAVQQSGDLAMQQLLQDALDGFAAAIQALGALQDAIIDQSVPVEPPVLDQVSGRYSRHFLLMGA